MKELKDENQALFKKNLALTEAKFAGEFNVDRRGTVIKPAEKLDPELLDKFDEEK